MECHAGQTGPAGFARSSAAAGQAEAPVVEPDFGPHHEPVPSSSTDGRSLTDEDPVTAPPAARVPEAGLTAFELVPAPVDLQLDTDDERGYSARKPQCRVSMHERDRRECETLVSVASPDPVTVTSDALNVGVNVTEADGCQASDIVLLAEARDRDCSVDAELPCSDRGRMAGAPASYTVTPLNGLVACVTQVLQDALWEPVSSPPGNGDAQAELAVPAAIGEVTAEVCTAAEKLEANESTGSGVDSPPDASNSSGLCRKISKLETDEGCSGGEAETLQEPQDVSEAVGDSVVVLDSESMQPCGTEESVSQTNVSDSIVETSDRTSEWEINGFGENVRETVSDVRVDSEASKGMENVGDIGGQADADLGNVSNRKTVSQVTENAGDIAGEAVDIDTNATDFETVSNHDRDVVGEFMVTVGGITSRLADDSSNVETAGDLEALGDNNSFPDPADASGMEAVVDAVASDAATEDPAHVDMGVPAATPNSDCEPTGGDAELSRDCRSPGLEKSASCPLIDEPDPESTAAVGARRRRVSFPEGGVSLVTGYIEPRNPLSAMYNASPETIAAAYRQSCQKHSSQPLPAVLRQIAALPMVGDRVESFSLRGLRLDRAQCESLEEVLKKVQFNLVDVTGCGLDDDSAAALFEMIEFYDSALSVSFGGNRLGVRGWQAACRMVKASASLERLSAQGIELYDQSAAALGRALRLSANLRVLHLEGCRLHGRPMALLMAGLRQSATLRELYLGENELGTGDGSMLGNMLKLNLRLDLVDLRINSFDNDSAAFLLEGVWQQVPAARGDGLRALNLWCNRLTARTAGSLSVLLSRHSTLETLNLGRNPLGDEAARALKPALMGSACLRRLGLQQCRLGCEAAVALAEALADGAPLQRLDLRGNQIRAGGLLALTRALEHNAGLLQLDLDPAGGDAERQLLLARVRELCERNRQRQAAEAAEDAQRGESILRKLSAAWRRVSLTCDAPAADAAASVAASTSAAPTPETPPPSEERRRLVSPSPSPSGSPLARPCRSRFRVVRVSTEPGPGAGSGTLLARPQRSSSESEASSGSVSPSPSPQRRRGFTVTKVPEVKLAQSQPRPAPPD